MKTVGVMELRSELDEFHSQGGRGGRIGFVPTMGALHEGHLSLIRRARTENELVVVSIFVNPLQFGPSEDFDSYPRDLEADSIKAADAGVDVLFVPEAEEIYPQGAIDTRVDPGPIGEVLEGQFRPGFFIGVATICVKLFNLVQPHRAYFGEKDAQQLAVIRQVVRDLNLPIEIVGCPTVREDNGLAMSSRNAYLDNEGRQAATVLSQALLEARELILAGEQSAEIIKKVATEAIGEEPRAELQYIEVVEPETFQSIEEIADQAIIALAAFVDGTRLIDNVLVRREST